MPRTSLSSVVATDSTFVANTMDTFTGNVTLGVPLVKRLNDFSITRITYNTPGFRDFRRRNGQSRDELPMNPFEYEKTSHSNPYGQSSSQEVGSTLRTLREGVHYFWGRNDSPNGISPDQRASIDASAVNTSLSDLKNSKINVGVTLGEAQKTVQLVLGNAKRLAGSISELKRGNFNSAYQKLVEGRVTREGPPSRPKRGRNTTPSKALANEWLALQNGVKPLVNEVYNYAEALAKYSQKPSMIRTSTSRTHRWNTSYTGDFFWNGVPVRRVEYGSYTRKYVYVFANSSPVITDLASLGISNPLSWAWELLVHSYMIDWVLNVGGMIDALDGTNGYTFHKGCSTSFERSFISHKAHVRTRVNNFDESVDVEAQDYYVRCKRSVLSTFPSPALPHIDPKFSLTKGVTVLALIRQLFH